MNLSVRTFYALTTITMRFAAVHFHPQHLGLGMGLHITSLKASHTFHRLIRLIKSPYAGGLLMNSMPLEMLP